MLNRIIVFTCGFIIGCLIFYTIARIFNKSKDKDGTYARVLVKKNGKFVDATPDEIQVALARYNDEIKLSDVFGQKVKEVPMLVEDYLLLPYHRVIEQEHDESGDYFVAKVTEFDGCQSTGNTREEADHNLTEAMGGWIETKLANGFEVPMPNVDQ